MTSPEWRLTPGGTGAAYRRHRRRGVDACQAGKDAEAARGRRTRSSRWTAVHADRGNGRPRCGHERPHSIGKPGQEVTCKRCILLTLAGTR